MTKKRVMVLGMSPNVGGVETYIMNWLRNINHDKYEFYFPYYNEIAYKQELISMGGILLKLEVSRHNPIKYINYIGKIFKQYKFDAVYYNTCDIMSMDMIMFGKKYGVPVRIIHSHNSANIVKPNLLHTMTEKWCRKNLDKYATQLLACSDVAGKWMFGNRKFEIINNGINIQERSFNNDVRQKVRNNLNINDNIVFGFVGSLWEQKNPLFLIELFSKIHDIENKATLLVIGDGILRSKMEEMTQYYGIEHAVKFLGIRSDVSELMNAMDVFLLPSKFEGLPFVLVEAQASGLPCITSTNVSKESNISGEVLFLDLELGSNYWSKMAINHVVEFDRGKYGEIIKNKGYDIKSTVKKIEYYLDNR